MFRNKGNQGSDLGKKCGLNTAAQQLNIKPRGDLNEQSKRTR